MVEKVVRNGQVAVIISRGWGAGWSTWTLNPSYVDILLYHPKLVQLVESQEHYSMNRDTFAQWMKTELGIADTYFGGYEGLDVRWITQGTKFKVEEYDGAEYIITEADLPYTA